MYGMYRDLWFEDLIGRFRAAMCDDLGQRVIVTIPYYFRMRDPVGAGLLANRHTLMDIREQARSYEPSHHYVMLANIRKNSSLTRVFVILMLHTRLPIVVV